MSDCMSGANATSFSKSRINRICHQPSSRGNASGQQEPRVSPGSSGHKRKKVAGEKQHLLGNRPLNVRKQALADDATV